MIANYYSTADIKEGLGILIALEAQYIKICLLVKNKQILNQYIENVEHFHLTCHLSYSQ